MTVWYYWRLTFTLLEFWVNFRENLYNYWRLYVLIFCCRANEFSKSKLFFSLRYLLHVLKGNLKIWKILKNLNQFISLVVWLLFCCCCFHSFFCFWYVFCWWTSKQSILTHFILTFCFNYFSTSQYSTHWYCTKMKFFIKHFFSECDQIRSFMQICSHLIKKSLMESFILCAV